MCSVPLQAAFLPTARVDLLTRDIIKMLPTNLLHPAEPGQPIIRPTPSVIALCHTTFSKHLLTAETSRLAMLRLRRPKPAGLNRPIQELDGNASRWYVRQREVLEVSIRRRKISASCICWPSRMKILPYCMDRNPDLVFSLHFLPKTHKLGRRGASSCRLLAWALKREWTDCDLMFCLKCQIKGGGHTLEQSHMSMDLNLKSRDFTSGDEINCGSIIYND